MNLYIETSVISFWYDPRPHNREKRRATRRLLVLCRRGVHQGSVSEVVLEEITASREPYRSRDLALISRLGLMMATVDRRRYGRLMEAYEKRPILAEVPERDRQHIALFSVSDLEGLATYNLRHIANQIILASVREANREQGIEKPLQVAPPEAFLPPKV